MTKGQKQARNQYAWKTISKNSRSRAFWMNRETQTTMSQATTNAQRPTKVKRPDQ